MEEQILTIFYLCDEVLHALQMKEDPQVQMTNAEVMTVALTAATFFSGNFETSRQFLHEHGYMPEMLSKSRCNRRLHAIGESVWHVVFSLCATVFKQINGEQEYGIDSFPVPVCDTSRIRRSQISHGEEYRGYIASKRRYFYGLRVHMLISITGQPIEFLLTPGASHDAKIVKQFAFDLPANAVVNADTAYNAYGYEALLQEATGIRLKPLCKKNSKRPFAPWIRFWQERVRKRVETTFSLITQGFPKAIHAVTATGFELKVVLFVLAFTIQCL